MVTAVIGCSAVAGGAVSAAVALAAHSSAERRFAPAQGLDVLPFPGTPDAAPGASIDLPAVSRAQVRSAIAVGSRSGLHPGRLSAQPAGNGTAFTPDRPFSPGEHVSVTATFRSPTTGTASGAPRAKQVNFSFSVARSLSFASKPTHRAIAKRPTASSSKPLTHTFVTHQRFRAPVVIMKGKDPDPAAGDIFLDAQNTGQNAAYILNPLGALLWYQPAPSQTWIHDVEVQSYNGNPVLTYWRGQLVGPDGRGGA